MAPKDSPAFRAVVTTGIYCRDGCPAAPLAKNVRDYAFAAAAEADGYRPCRRCRPERLADPGRGTDPPDLVCRALRMIASGALDTRSTDELAADLGVSDRHLRRLFHAHVGTSPSAVARSRRAHLARRLLDDSDLTVSDIGFAAGFSSLRQMNRVMQIVFHRTPTQLRGRSRRVAHPAGDGSLVLQLAAEEPIAVEPLFRFLQHRAVPGVETVTADSYERTVLVEGAPGLIRLRPVPGTSEMHLCVLLPSYRSLSHVVEQARRLLDLDAPIGSIDHQLSTSSLLRSSVRRWPGMRVPGCWDPFEQAIRVVLGQQITVAAATTIAGRVVEAHGTRVDTGGGEPRYLFPSAEVLAGLEAHELPLPAARAETVIELSRAVAGGDLEFGDHRPIPEVVEQLESIPGIGPWTAAVIALRSLGDRDAFPSGDVGVRRALTPGSERPPAMVSESVAVPWRPYRSYATVRLWHSLAST